MIISHFPGGGGKVGLPKYTYTGQHELVQEADGAWKIKFLTSGLLTVLRPMTVDIFVVGGGAGGMIGQTPQYAGGGGAGGYTATIKQVELERGKTYAITIGAGGAGGWTPVQGGTTSFADIISAAGGGVSDGMDGGNGGCGGGAGGYGDVYTTGGDGGSDGGPGYYSNGNTSGAGQNTTTREFGEADGQLYAGGGGGAAVTDDAMPGAGGAGGGGRGGSSSIPPQNGEANTGGGGGGSVTASIAAGGSGIAIIRNTRG